MLEQTPRRLFVFLSFCFFVVFGAAGALAATKEPHQILLDMKHDMILAGEKGRDLRDFEGASEKATRMLNLFLDDNVESEALVERDGTGMTPLIAASFEGYIDIVETLLKNAKVISHIEDRDARGLSAWDYANFAMKQTLWICNPTILGNPFILSPLRSTYPYYAKTEAYRKIRDLLAKAGANTDMEKTKSKWKRLCAFQKPEILARILGNADLQSALIAEATASAAVLKKKGR